MATAQSRWWCTGYSRKEVGSKIVDGLRKFILVDNQEAVTVGELDQNVESRKVVKPKFTTDFPEAVVREGADELTLRADEEGALRTFIVTTNVVNKKVGATARG